MIKLLCVALAGLSLVTAAFLIGGRYDSHVTSPLGAVVRVDRFTGEIVKCWPVGACTQLVLPQDGTGGRDFSDRAAPAQ